MKQKAKPRTVIAKISRTVIEKATVVLDRDGFIEEVDEVHEVIDFDNAEIMNIDVILSVHP